MPVEKGTDFLEDVKAKAPDIVRVMFSGSCEVQDIIEAINRVNAFRFISKPWKKTR